MTPPPARRSGRFQLLTSRASDSTSAGDGAARGGPAGRGGVVEAGAAHREADAGAAAGAGVAVGHEGGGLFVTGQVMADAAEADDGVVDGGELAAWVAEDVAGAGLGEAADEQVGGGAG